MYIIKYLYFFKAGIYFKNIFIRTCLYTTFITQMKTNGATLQKFILFLNVFSMAAHMCHNLHGHVIGSIYVMSVNATTCHPLFFKTNNYLHIIGAKSNKIFSLNSIFCEFSSTYVISSFLLIDCLHFNRMHSYFDALTQHYR